MNPLLLSPPICANVREDFPIKGNIITYVHPLGYHRKYLPGQATSTNNICRANVAKCPFVTRVAHLTSHRYDLTLYTPILKPFQILPVKTSLVGSDPWGVSDVV